MQVLMEISKQTPAHSFPIPEKSLRVNREPERIPSLASESPSIVIAKFRVDTTRKLTESYRAKSGRQGAKTGSPPCCSGRAQNAQAVLRQAHPRVE